MFAFLYDRMMLSRLCLHQERREHLKSGGGQVIKGHILKITGMTDSNEV